LPIAQLDVLCSKKNIILLQDANLADDLLVAGKNPLELLKLIMNIRKRKYDLIINLVTRPSFTFGLIARLGGPKAVRIASEQEQFAYFYNRNLNLPPKSNIHMMKRKFLVCQDIIDTDISHLETPWVEYSKNVKEKARQLYQESLQSLGLPEGKKRLAVLNLTAGLDRREWPVNNYVVFLKKIIERYQEKIDGWIVLTDPGKPEKTTPLVENVNHPRLKSLPAVSDFRVIMEFLRLVDVLITPDTSISHAASAMGTPVLVLTIGENKKVWDPVGVTFKIVFSDDPFSLEQLPVKKVEEGFEQLMKEVVPIK
jgi:ADP-heptose:LPS heptosyltransferase